MKMGDATVTEFGGAPQLPEGPSWVARSANFAVRLTRVRAGTRLVRNDNPDEYFLLLPDVGATVTAVGERVEADKGTLVIVPPGASTITAKGEGEIVCVFSSAATDIMAAAENNDRYTEPVAAPLVTWPMPTDGYRLRVYKLDDYNRTETLMRLFRTRNLMINVFRPREVPRDIRKLSPHSHEDFEQGSLCLRGTWSHHLRYPWTPDLTTWREDREIKVGSPSLTVIPAKVVHTSRNTNEGGSWLVDIFAPPRADFSRRPGLVNNGDSYPLPPEIAALPPLATAD
jgi:mannose-6-phosphate isomerase-like protein (cupin superfamily)